VALDRSFGRSVRSGLGFGHAAKVNNLEHIHIQSEIARIVVDRLSTIFGESTAIHDPCEPHPAPIAVTNGETLWARLCRDNSYQEFMPKIHTKKVPWADFLAAFRVFS
jgi:hypothetical protein